ncbi:hypothetical protein TMU01_30850 [Tenuibacillus multivorans]|uniref:Uncharacterized protein n=1 Tax=Tenuibacillus multivorans TaxID=237069 RepID=A0A1H0FA08_9BACI|nr:hypothetical protein TMU01_30850 [Tenuibacillus multivorans]SDN91431.1 hypothetical protein SAMN05216498_0200 [Tenuibacillus multivorans]
MKIKGNVKRVGQPIYFWGKRARKVPLDIKEMVYDQYYSINTLFIYCASSLGIIVKCPSHVLL